MIGIGKTFTGVFVASTALVVALVVAHEGPRYDVMATFRTTNLIVDSTATIGPTGGSTGHALINGDMTINTNGQNALFSTFGGANQNIWIGGGGQSFGGAAFPGTGQNTSLGIDAMHAVTTGNGDTAIGFDALLGCTTCYTSTAVGYDALGAVTTAVDNTAVGYLAGRFVTTGNENTTIGVESLTACTTCASNAAVGLGAGAFITTGTHNTAIGTASRCGTTGTFNSCLGDSSGAGIQGATADIAIGPFTLQAATSSNANIAIGSTDLTSLTTGQNNTAVGTFALTGVVAGSENACFGDHACASGDVSNSSALGAFALESQTTGFNVGVGTFAGDTITSGVANTVVGYNDTTGITTGNGNTIIGSNVGGLAGGLTGNIIIADGSGNIRIRCDSTGACTFDGGILSPGTPTVNHGALSASSTNWVGDVTGVGAFTTVTLTYSTPFPTGSRCQVTPLNAAVAIEQIIPTPVAASVTFSCTAIVAGIAANCDDFTYSCVGF